MKLIAEKRAEEKEKTLNLKKKEQEKEQKRKEKEKLLKEKTQKKLREEKEKAKKNNAQKQKIIEEDQPSQEEQDGWASFYLTKYEDIFATVSGKTQEAKKKKVDTELQNQWQDLSQKAKRSWMVKA